MSQPNYPNHGHPTAVYGGEYSKSGSTHKIASILRGLICVNWHVDYGETEETRCR